MAVGAGRRLAPTFDSNITLRTGIARVTATVVSQAPTADAIRAAARALDGVAVRTPLVELPELSAARGAMVQLKCEQNQPIHAFKVRGAFTAINRLTPEQRGGGVLTHSSGNHGQAVAYIAARFGIRAVIVMPEDSPKVKIAGVRAHGGDIVFCQRTERLATAAAIQEREGLTLIPPFEHPDVILGQSTVGLEILEDAPQTGTILVPVGGGGLLAGVASAVRAFRPEVRVIAVEPQTAAKVPAALAAGAPVAIDRPHSVADGLLPPAVGHIAFGIFRDVVREAVQVSEAEIRVAVRWLYQHGLRVEPSGAVTTAALLAGRVSGRDPVVAIATGGNVDDDVFQELIRG